MKINFKEDHCADLPAKAGTAPELPDNESSLMWDPDLRKQGYSLKDLQDGITDRKRFSYPQQGRYDMLPPGAERREMPAARVSKQIIDSVDDRDD